MSFSGSIGIVGAGNAATHFAKALYAKSLMVKTIYARSSGKGKLLAQSIECDYQPISQLELCSVDVLILAVSDNAIEDISAQIKSNTLVVHCSGSTDIEVLQSQRTGVLYPLQTMSLGKEVNFDHIPILIETAVEADKIILNSIATSLSSNVVYMNSAQRLKLHLAAVFACNFSNYMMSTAQAYLEKENIPFELLHHLIKETAEKAIALGPKKAQTGPAIRGDNKVLQKHESLLENQEELLPLYQIISNLIKSQHGLL